MTRRADQLDEATLLLEELESIEAKLRTLQEGLTRSHRLATLGTMASVIAHEFNNILTPMISYCQIALADPNDTAMMRKAVEKSLRGAERAAEVSQSMLGFARPSERREQGRCEVGKVVTEVFSCLVRPPEKDGLSVDVQVDEGIIAAMSPTALQQVLLNMTLNATRAMGRNRGRLGISAESAEGWVTIRVSDTGHGIDKDLQDNIFDPFVTHREAGPDGESEGTGLGLAICKQLIEAAGGSVAVEATSPEGTTFRIDLPAG